MGNSAIQDNRHDTQAVNTSLADAFYTQWLKQLPTPYIGINWSARTVGNEDSPIEIDLEKIAECLRDVTGSIVVLQQNPRKDDLDFLARNLKIPLLDCSDLYAKHDELFAAVSLLHDFVGVPDLVHELRRTLNLPGKLLIPLNYQSQKHKDEIFPKAKTYLENHSDGWTSALTQLKSDIIVEWQTSVRSKPEVETSNHDRLVSHASTLVTDRLTEQTEAHVQPMTAIFNSARHSTSSSLNIFVYHTAMGDASKLEFKDVNMNLSKYDYELVVSVFLSAIGRWRADANIYLVTNSDSTLFRFADKKVRVVGLNVSAEQPMYERVNAMYAYVNSDAFDADTLFLDSDALLNSRFDTYLEGDYDIAITTREGSGLMPVNEGVIVARREKKERVETFFRRYLATYDNLFTDTVIQKYGDIRKWRGGQLSLNAITRDAAPFSAYRQLNIYGTTIRSLPCDQFNFSWEYGHSIDRETLQNKIIIHVKGARKVAMEKIKVIIESFAPEKKSTGYIAPQFALFNKMYKEPPFIDESRRKNFTANLSACADTIGANQPASGALLADDMFVWFRNLGFLAEDDFTHAFAPYATDPLLRARIWRVYTLCWAARSCLRVDGDFVDLGCYDGRTVHVMARYVDFNTSGKRYYLYDLFENPTAESRKAKHGPNLFNEVTRLFSEYPAARVIKGPVPQSFSQGLPDKIAFAQIDLNEVDAEVAALEAIYDRITPGGMIVLDDFGFKRYAASQMREEQFFRRRGDVVFESPTGQGIFIKRS